MDILIQIIQHPALLLLIVVGLILGLILGLVIGWNTVQWENAAPAQLADVYRNDYLIWVANEYNETGDMQWALDKLGLQYWETGEFDTAMENLIAAYTGTQTETNLRALAQIAEMPAPADGDTGDGAAEGEGSRSLLQTVGLVCGASIIIIAVVGALYYVYVNFFSGAQAEERPLPTRPGREISAMPSAVPGEGQPVSQFITTYKLGEDHYDPSFSIELDNGEFMGECGVGISETLGVGAPNKVAAFEVWLFDKNDIRTVTKVLMSDYAYHDDALNTKLAPKGEPVLVEAGTTVDLETKTLRVSARIVDVAYGSGNLPANSFFENLTVELTAWLKPGYEEVSPSDFSDITDNY